jgi:hypothetical protein
MTQAQSAAVDLTQVFALGALSFRNRIINGDMRIPQRSPLAAVATTGWAYGQCDRWSSYTSAPSTVASMAAASGGVFGVSNRWWTKYTVTTPPSDLTGNNMIVPLCQIIEGVNCFDLNSSPIAISFIFNAFVAGQYSVAVMVMGNGNVTQGVYVTTFNYATAQTPQVVKLIIPQMPGSFALANDSGNGIRLSIGAINTGNFQASAPQVNSWVPGSGAYSAPGNVNWAANANNWVMLTDAQLEMGAVCTPFERRPQSVEYALCQRYYQTARGELGAYAPSGGTITGYMNFMTIMRASPTAAVVGSVSYNNTSGYVVDTATPTGYRVYALVTTAGVGFVTGTSLSFNAELS